MPIELSELQDAIVDDLPPMLQRIAGRNPVFVELVLRRLVARSQTRYPAAFFEGASDSEEFRAGIALEMAEMPIAIGPFWLVVLLQVLLPALIRLFILWWSESDLHRTQLAELRTRLSETPQAKPWSVWNFFAGLLGLTIGIVLFVSAAGAAPPSYETSICKQLVPVLAKDHGGKWETEHRNWDGTRVDLISANYAVEVDFASKWAECFGQACYYGHLTHRKPVCLLLATTAEDHFVYRCQTVCRARGVELWVYRVDANGRLTK